MRIAITGAAAIGLCALALAGCSKKDDAEKATATAEAPAAERAGGVGAGGGAPAGMPKPRTGKWRLTTAMPDMPVRMPAQEVCFTEQMVNDTEWSKGQMPKDMDCSEMSTRFVGGAIVSHSVCKVNGVTMTSDVRTSGDFQNRYTVETSSSMNPAPPGMKNPTKMTITAERLGDC